MNYFEIDFAVLRALSRRDGMSADALLTEMGRIVGWMATPEGIASSLAVLEADGYVTVEATDRILTARSRAFLTDKGRGATVLRGLAKLFSSKRWKAWDKMEHGFCQLPRPAVAPYALDRASFAAWKESPACYESSRFWLITDTGDGSYSISFSNHYQEPNEDGLTDDLSTLYDLDGLRRFLHDMADTALLFAESAKSRKVLLSGAERAYVMTFAFVVDEEGYSVMRITAAPVLFNRQRFVGKRDSDLDYAQCGDNVLSATLNLTKQLIGLIGCTLRSRPDLLDEELGEKADQLYEIYS